MDTQRSPVLVAHRGYSAAYPENTLIAIEKAFQCGACFVEFDVQISCDGIPIVIHDVALLRTTGVQGNVNKLSALEVTAITAGEPARFGDRFASEKIPTLQAMVELLMQWPSRKAFLEIKRASTDYFSVNQVMQCVKAVIEPVLHQIIIISFDADVLRQAREIGCTQTGWVFDQWNAGVRETLVSLEPDYVFVEKACMAENNSVMECGSAVSPAAHWQWAVYEVDNAETALDWANKGVSLVETNSIGELMQHPLLKAQRCCD